MNWNKDWNSGFISQPEFSMEEFAKALDKASPALRDWATVTQSWLTAPPPKLLNPALFYATLCGGKKRKNQNVVLRSGTAHPDLIIRKGEYFIASGERRIVKRGGTVIEESFYHQASKKYALRWLERKKEKDFSELLKKVGEEITINL